MDLHESFLAAQQPEVIEMAKTRKASAPRASGVQFYRDAAGDFRWRYVGQTGRILADSSEGYRRINACEAGFAALAAALSGTPAVTPAPVKR